MDSMDPDDGRRGRDVPGPDAPTARRPITGPPHPAGPNRGRKAAQVAGGVVRGSGRAATAAARAARRASTSGGAGTSGLYRLLELHAVNAAGDAALTISLAGSLFFSVPSGQARGQVALFLGITMLPFAIMAPLIGPFLDRFRRGRRWAIGSTLAIRAFLVWVLAGAVSSKSIWLFPAALGCLVASKAYGVTRASAVPRVLPADTTLVKANSRISLAGIAGGAISAPLAGGTAAIGPQWSLRYAFLLYLAGTVLAVLLPDRVDSTEGEEELGVAGTGRTGVTGRAIGLPISIITALRCNVGLRVLSGFLTMFMAFLLREHPIAGWHHSTTLLLGLVIGAAGAGSTIGTLLGVVLRTVKPEIVVFVTLTADAAAAVYAAFFYGLVAAVVLGLVTGVSQGLGKLSLDAVIQREVPERVRTSVFARSETLLQLAWVVGGFLGVFMPLIARLGLTVIAVILIAWLVIVIKFRPRQTPSGPAGRPTGGPRPADAY
jgi:MFS family permease